VLEKQLFLCAANFSFVAQLTGGTVVSSSLRGLAMPVLMYHFGKSIVRTG
jgi:hypothetical protein